MAENTDAERILRDRDRLRSVERARIEDERRERQLELARLRHAQAGDVEPDPPAPSEPLPRVVRVHSNHPAPSFDAPRDTADPASIALGTPHSRPIGGAIRTRALEEFLKTDPGERFDLLVLNSLPLSGIVSQAVSDGPLLATIAQRAEALMVRIKRELDDPLSAGEFLRGQVLRWFRSSGQDQEWASRTPGELLGLFAESRVSGGRLAPWLNLRLWALREAAIRAGPLRRKVRRGLSRDRPAEGAVSRTPSQQIHAEVAQAILDDLATHPRDPDAPLPLVRLSELSVRRQLTTVNDALALLFSGPEVGPFVVLHPNRYPDCDELLIRPPAPGATGAALAFSLTPGRLLKKTPGPRSRGEPADAGGRDRPGEEVDEAIDATTIWEAVVVPAAGWKQVVEEARRSRHRLEPPPKEYRTAAAYLALRDALMDDAEFRKAFLAAKWRGRPAGPALLATLLQKGVIAPEVSTDHEYLEAELGELAHGDPAWSPADGVWRFRNWTITREGSHRDGYRFRAEQSR